MEENYKKQYLKYKLKYLNEKNKLSYNINGGELITYEQYLGDAIRIELKENNDYKKIEELNNMKSFNNMHIVVVSPKIDKLNINILFKMLINNYNIVELELNDVHLNKQGIDYLHNALFYNHTLVRLRIKNTILRSYYTNCLGNILRDNTTLRSLIIIHCGIESASSIFYNLEKNNTLIELVLYDTYPIHYISERIVEDADILKRIKDYNIKILAEALSKNTSIINLNLCNDNLGDEIIKYILDMLKVNSTIIKLDLYGNSLSNKIIIPLCEALKMNSSLTELNLKNNYMNRNNFEVQFIDVYDEFKKKGRSFKLMTDFNYYSL